MKQAPTNNDVKALLEEITRNNAAPTNEELIALLDNCVCRFSVLPESFNSASVIKLIQARLRAASTPDQAVKPTLKAAPAPAKILTDMDTNPVNRTNLKEGRLVNPFSNHIFTEEFLESATTVFPESCFVMDLSRFFTPTLRRAEEKHSHILAAIGNTFKLLEDTKRWPRDIGTPYYVLQSIGKQITTENIHQLVSDFGTKLIVGAPDNIPQFNKHIDKEAINSLAAQLNEINRSYSGWTIQSNYVAEDL